MHTRRNQKLSAKFYGPYPVVKRIGTVAYKLQLPPTAAIHPVFHVSQLKKHVGNHVIQTDPPVPPKTPLLQPQQVLERRMVKRGNVAATQFLVRWRDLPLTEATWEDANEFQWRFPQFNLEDKVEREKGVLSRMEKQREEEGTGRETKAEIYVQN